MALSKKIKAGLARLSKVAREGFGSLGEQAKLGLSTAYRDNLPVPVALRGEVFLSLQDPSGNPIQTWHKKNIITFDASLLVARLCRDPLEPAHGINMLAVGTGALGPILSPDAMPKEQRRLNNEIARKAFSSVTFRDGNGAASAIPTKVVDFTCVFGQGEAVGPLNEMGLMSTISDNVAIQNLNPNFAGQGGQPYDPTVDVTQYDMLFNALSFPVVSKAVNSILTITWRITF